MPLSPAFSVSQSAQTPANVTVTDESTGSDVSVTQRRIYIQDSEGNYLVPDGTTTDYIEWAYADSSKTVDVLDEDKAVSIRVEWLDVSNNILYSETQQYCLAEYNKQNFYYLIQQQGLTPGIVQDTTYFSNIATYWANIIGAIQAVETGDDIAASQASLNRATNMLNNENMFF